MPTKDSLAKTGQLTEERVKQMLEKLGLQVRKPIPDRGVDLEAWLPSAPSHIAKIQVKGRNPKNVKTLRWFQLRVTRAQLKKARDNGSPADSAWQVKLAKADFLVLDAVKTNETWVLSIERATSLIQLNETRYGYLPGNTFSYDEPLQGKQKEMNLDIEIDGIKLTERFKDCLGNFEPVLSFLNNKRGQQPGTHGD